jgi:hypothetical protein
MSAIGAGGGLAAMGLSAQGMGNGIRAKASKGADAKGGAQTGQKPAHGSDFGRDGALSRGQGFSQKDGFTPAKQAQKSHQHGAKDPAAAHKPQAQQQPQAKQDTSQAQQKQQTQQTDATKAAMQAGIRRMEAQQQLNNEMMQIRQAMDDEIKETMVKMWKKFLEWLKEMDAIFLQPSPQ